MANPHEVAALRVPFTGEPPVQHFPGDAGADLVSAETVTLRTGDGAVLVRTTTTGLAIPFGHVGMVCSRSGLALRSGIFVVNAPGIIDAGYRGPIHAILACLGPGIYHTIVPGDRIAQLVVVKCENLSFLRHTPEQFAALPHDGRGTDGFGSTGT